MGVRHFIGILQSMKRSGEQQARRSSKKPEMKGCRNVFLFVWGLLFAGIPVMILISRIPDYRKEYESRNWEKVPYELIKINYKETKSEELSYTIEAKYSYEYEGENYVSEQVYVDEKDYDSLAKVSKEIRTLKNTENPLCFVNPYNPRDAKLLERSSSNYVFTFLFISVFVIIGLSAMFGPMFSAVIRRKKLKKSALNDTSQWKRDDDLVYEKVFSESGYDGDDDEHDGDEYVRGRPVQRGGSGKKSPQKNGLSGLGTVVFGLVFASFGGVFLFFMFIKPMMKAKEAESWTKTECVVTHSQVRSYSSSDGTTYSVDIRYDYVFDDELYTSNTYDFVVGSSSGRSSKQKVVDKYPVGKSTICYVNPDAPLEAVLQPDASREKLWIIIPLVFVGVGLAIFTSGLWGLLTSKKNSRGAKKRNIRDFESKREPSVKSADKGGTQFDPNQSGADAMREYIERQKKR